MNDAVRVFRQLARLLDVDLTDLADGDAIVWDEAAAKFKPGSGGDPAAVRCLAGTLPSGQDSVSIALGDGELIAGAPVQQRVDGGVQFQGVSYAGAYATLQFTGAPDADLDFIVIVQLP